MAKKRQPQQPDELFKKLISEAENYFTIEDLCKAVDILPETYYLYTKENPEIRKTVHENLAKRFVIRSQSTDNGGNIVTIQLTYDDAEKSQKNRFSDEHRKKLIELICFAYEKGISVNMSCKHLGLDDSTFFKWANPKSPIHIKYAYDRFELAKEVYRDRTSADMVVQARIALADKLSEKTITNETLYYKVKGPKGEEKVLDSVSEHKRVILPELQAISLALNNIDPEFRKATAGGQMIDDASDMQRMTADELLEELNKENERNRQLTGNNTTTEHGDTTA